MADELTINVSAAYEDSEGTSLDIVIENLLTTISTKKVTRLKQNVGTSEEVLVLGDVSSLGYCVLVNRDATNFVELRVGTGGTKIIKLKPNNGVALFHFGTGVTAPYIIADTGACQVDIFLCST